MKEKIYTIPVMDAFKSDCECPICSLEKKLELECLEYTLGASMMEPDHRIESNKKGFCKKHFNLLYKQSNRLSLALILDTHLDEINNTIKKSLSSFNNTEDSSPHKKSFFQKFSQKNSDVCGQVDEIINFIHNLEQSCVICEKIDSTIERYTEVIFYLWKKENDFKDIFNTTKGFCLNHLKLLLVGMKKYLDASNQELFIKTLAPLLLNNLDRVKEDIHWFTLKLDYRNNDAPWKTSKDAIPRTIEKIAGNCNLSE